jgi:copper transport protein
MARRGGAASFVALLLSLTLSLLLLPTVASAHANLERSSPAASTVVVDQPRQVTLWFSEEPELRLTDLWLLDPAGHELAQLAVRPVPGDTKAVLAAMPALQPGTFVVVWRTTSAVDGHTTQGAIPFTYGLGQVPQSVSVAGLTGTQLYVPTPLAVVARGLTFAGTAGLAGGLAFGPLVLWPALAAAPAPPRRRGRGARQVDGPGPAERAATRALLVVGLASVALLVVGTALSALAQASEAAGVAPAQALGEPLQRALVGTRYGALFGARVALALALGLLLPLAAGTPRGPLRWVALALAGALLLTLSLGAHAAAASILTGLVVAVDWLHVAAASVWVGGLAQLCLVAAGLTAAARREGAEGWGALLAGLVERFSRMLWVVLLIAATGLVQTLIEVGTVPALESTPYGQTLLLKIALVAAMGMVGVFHWRVIGPRMRALVQAASRAAAGALERVGRRFRWTSAAEASLGVLVLLTTGLLTAQQPARDAAVALRHVTASGRADDLALTLTVTPGEAGLNRYELRVSPVPQGVEKVVLRVHHRDMDMGEQEVPLQEQGPGLYAAEGGQLSMFGRWAIEPLVRRTGQADARVELDLSIDQPLAVRTADVPPFEITTPMVVGAQAVLFGLLVLVAAGQLRRRDARAALIAVLVGLVALGFGGYTAATAVSAESTSPARLRNPLPIDDAALARGREVYSQNCLSCHGVAGRGDGPLGRSLNPRPADLRIHVTQHPEGQLFAWVADGVPGTAMPAFRDLIPEDDRWRVIAFIKGFADDGPAPAQTAVAQLRPPATTPSKP